MAYNGGGALDNAFKDGNTAGLRFQGFVRQANVFFMGRAEFRQNAVDLGVRLGRRKLGTEASKAYF